MPNPVEPNSPVFSVLDVIAAILTLAGLLPTAGGLPSIAPAAVPLADAMWFTANLTGPAILLAAGLRLLLRRLPRYLYLSGYTLLLLIAGELRLFAIGFRRLALDWLVTALCITLLLLLFRHVWVWGAVGGLWSGALLGVWVIGGLMAYSSATTALFPALLAIQIVGAITALVVGVLHLRLRPRLQPN